MNYAELAFTDAVKDLQAKNGSRHSYEKMERFSNVDGLSPREINLIATRDSFYMATYGENEYPYIQHRGGPKGFLKVLDDHTLAFLDFSGNRQYISVGNIKNNAKVSLILVDYPTRTRLKIYAEAEIIGLNDDSKLTEDLNLGDYRNRPERIIKLHVRAFDWNCPQHITPRYTEAEIRDVLETKDNYIKTLEAEVLKLRTQK